MDYVSLTLDIEDGSGNIPGRACSASFVPSAVLTDPGAGITDQAPVSVAFSGTGEPAVSLLATDNPGPMPSGWTWGTAFTGPGMPGPFSFFLAAAPDTFTATDASPCVFTLAGTDAPFAGTGVQLSGGSQPAGFTAGTTYYVTDPSGSSYSLAATPGGDALESASAGSGSVITVSQVMSNLIPVSSGTAFQGYLPLPSGTPSAGQAPLATGVGEASEWGDVSGGGDGSGTVTSVSVATADGFAGTVANPTTTPAITVKTTVTGILKGGGTSVSAATAGTDYLAPSGIGSALTGITAAQVGADATGAAASALTSAESFATAAVGTETSRAEGAESTNAAAISAETSRAETAEAVLLPLAGGTMSGAIAMGAHKVTGLTNGSAAQDAAAFGQLPSSSSPLPLTQGGTGVSEASDSALLAALGAAPLASPALTGTPAAPTATALTDSTQIATTAYADAAVAAETSRAGTAEALKAPLASPALTGTPTAPTASALTSTTQLATTAYADSAVTAETSRAETAEALKAPLASPGLTGTPTAPTKTALTNSTAIATTAYADAAVAVETTRAGTAEALALPKAGGTMTGWLAPAVAALTFVGSGTTLVNAALGNAFSLTLTASTTTLGNPSNAVDGQVIRFRVTQGGSGSFTLAYGTAYDFGAAGAPTLSTAAAKVDILGFEYVASLTKWVYLGSGLGF